MKKINIFSSRFFVESNNKYLFFIFGAVTFLVYSFLFCHVYAESGNIVQINFTSSPQTIDASSLSSVISIQTRNNLGELEKTSETTHIVLHSSSPTGTFYNANASSCTTLIETPFVLKMNSGTANKNFCYKDATAGTHTLEISAEGKTWTSATQDVVINSLPTPPVEEPEFTEVSGVIGEDTTWTKAESPYVVTGPTFINEDVTLTIEPGVVVKFTSESNASLYVFGKIIANGEEGNEIHFTSNYDDIGGSTDEDYEDCNYENYDEEGNGIGEEVCTMLDWYEPSASDWDGLYFRNSRGSILDNVYIKYAHDAVSLESSDINFKNINILNSFSGITGYNNSHVDILDGTINALNEDAFVFFTDSTLTIQGVSMIDVYNGFTIFGNSDLNIKDSSLSCSNDGFVFYDNSKLLLSQMNINCGHDGILLFNDVGADINDAKISGASHVGIISYNNTKPYLIKISNSEILNNEYGFIVWDSPFVAHQNSIYSNRSKGVETFFETLVDFSSNYWGDKTGPKNLSTNPLGLGNEVSDYVTYQPFLKIKPGEEALSNIMFIPGFQASRLYKMVGDNEAGTEYEKKLWEPGSGNNLLDMLMGSNGESLDKDIYTKDVVKIANVYGFGVLDVYKSFMDNLDKKVEKNEIAEWKEIAYDWRLSPLDIVNRGIKKENGEISYTEELSDGQIPYIISQLKELSESSYNEKVTIVTHSNGGLVAKALIAKLIEMKNNGESNLIDKIDNLIVVAPPLVGTPKAILGILHGYDQGTFYNIISGRKNARDLGVTLPGAYGLLPSGKYVSEVDSGLIYLDESLNNINNWRNTYGESINTHEEFKNFLLNTDNNRIKPDHDDLVNPAILNKDIFKKAELLHQTIDNLKIPENIKFYQIAGWGLPTSYNLTYKSKNECDIFRVLSCLKKKKVLSSDVDFIYGDETVVAGSALYGDGIKYYLNLYEYNKNNSNKKHINIFEVQYLFDLFDDVLKNKNEDLPEYITKTEPERNISFTVLKMRSPVAMDIYNEDGLHTGLIENEDPNLDKIEEGIPNSLYVEIGEEKYIVIPSEGNYKLRLTGLSDGIFTLEQEQTVGGLSGSTILFKDIPTTSLLKGELEIKSNTLTTGMSLDRDGDGVFEEEIGPTDLGSEEESKDEEVETPKRSSSGSRLFVNPKIVTYNNTEDREVYNPDYSKKVANTIQGRAVDRETSRIISNTESPQNENISTEKGSALTASAGSLYSENSGRIKLQVIIVGGFILLLLSLKFIFKII